MNYEPYPYDDHFQFSVLQLAIQDPQFLPQYSDTIRPAYFRDPDHMSICRLLLQYFERYKERPTLSLIDAEILDYGTKNAIQQDVTSRLRRLTDTLCRTPVEGREAILDRIIRWAQRQEFKLGLLKAIDLAKEDVPERLDEAVEIMRKSLRVGHAKSMGIEFFSNAENLATLMKSSPMYDPSLRIPTPLPRLNALLSGGLGPGELGVIEGEAKKGKSTWLLNVAAIPSAFHHRTVVYFTNELREIDVMFRLASRLTGMPLETIESAADSEDYKRNIRRFVQEENYLRVQYYPPGGASVDTLRSYLSRLEVLDSRTPELIIVDEADRLRAPGNSSSDNSWSKLGKVYEQLIQLGDEFSCPVWTASQFNRQGFNVEGSSWHETGQVPGAAFTAGSIQKVQLATLVCSIHQSPRQKEAGECTIYVDRARRGADGVFVQCQIDRARMLLTEKRFDTPPPPPEKPVADPTETLRLPA